jgi:hypothetical protein
MAQATLGKPRPARSGKKAPKPSCADCFFQRNMLCALEADEPCPTFRHHEQGLTPPPQLSFVFRRPRQTAAWTFDDPN